MARQLNLLATGQIIPTALHVEMEKSYLEYAMSVIVGRALPDVRDGLKPVHRRILYAMHELGLTPDRPYRKCARVVGDVLGKYHPHGDQAVYDALARMVQDFSSRYPLLAGHGNFGSVDNDPPAAMRYTETRLAPIAHQAMLSEINEATVDFTNNFDNSQQEPVVLPAQLPLLLLNGCAGIAVGMATNVPPHNLGEVVDGLIALIDNPQLPEEKLAEIIPGPDFPTGGEIIETEGIKETYRTGRGTIPVRGVAKIEKVYLEKRRNKERTAIVITELPYQVNKSGWIEKVAELVNQARLEGIADLRDESDRQGMRVVIELKRDSDPQIILKELYQHTALQTNFGAIMLALVNNKPVQLSLRELLEAFLQFREQTLTRQYTHELEQSQKRLHLLAGLLVALNHLDTVVEILRNAPDGTTAKISLQEQLDISQAQADSILAMPMRRLTGLERQKLQTEYDDLQARINQLQTLLNNRHELMKFLKKELRSLKRQFGDVRRTRIVTTALGKKENKQGSYGTEKRKDNRDKELEEKEPKRQGRKGKLRESGDKALKEQQRQKSFHPSSLIAHPSIHSAKAGKSAERPHRTPPESASSRTTEKKKKGKNADVTEYKALNLPLFPAQTPPEEAQVVITYQGNVYWQLPQPESTAALKKKSEEIVVYSETIGKQAQLVIVTDSGKAYPVSILDIPPADGQPKNLLHLLPNSAQKEAEKAVAHFFLPDPSKTSSDLVLLTQQGRIKRLPISELKSLTQRGVSLIKLKERDRLSNVCLAQAGQEMAIATNGGRILRCEINEQQLPLMGRSAQGNQALRLRYGEQLVGCVSLNADASLLLVTQGGYSKRLPISTLRLAKLGDIGTQALQFTSKTDTLVGMVAAKAGTNVILLTNAERRLFLPVDSLSFWGKDGTGDRLTKLKSEESIISVISRG